MMITVMTKLDQIQVNGNVKQNEKIEMQKNNHTKHKIYVVQQDCLHPLAKRIKNLYYNEDYKVQTALPKS